MRGPALEELLRRGVVLGGGGGVVVVHLVVVPGDVPGVGGVGGLQVWVGLAQGITQPVVLQGKRFVAEGVGELVACGESARLR